MTTTNCFFDNLPEEVLTTILSYMDIPSLASITNSHKARDGNVSQLASDDIIWFGLIRSRFGIGRDNRRRRQGGGGVVVMKKGGCLPMLCSAPHGSLSAILVKKSSLPTEQHQDQHNNSKIMNYGRRRPASYGGRDWKSAYRSLSETMRIPETSLTGSGVGSGGGTNAIFASKSRDNNNKGTPVDYLGVWCLVNHAENCRTKTVVPSLPYRTDRRYIELKICLQNIKSGYGCIVIADVNLIQIASFHEEENFESLEGGLEDDRLLGVGSHEMIFDIVKNGPWAPRIALRRTAFGDAQYDDDVIGQQLNDGGGIRSIILRPFEVVVLSVHVSCPETHVYETDALSSMSSLRVPVMSDWPSGLGGAARCHQPQPSDGARNMDVSIARFLTEDELWEYYCLLPGGCMSLTDRSRLVPM